MPNIKKIKINDIVYDITVDTEASVSSTSTKPVQSKAVAEAINIAKAAVKDDLLNGAGEAYDTLKELGDLIDENKEILDVLKEAQADWNQNNSASPEYIKNRPFYEDGETVHQIDMKFIPMVEVTEDEINALFI